MNNKSKNTVATPAEISHFSAAAGRYHNHAAVQQQVAERLTASLDPWKDTLPPGPVLELGCGTGFLTKGLANLFNNRQLIISDSSQAMLEACKSNVSGPENIRFQPIDAGQIPVDEPNYALTISNFAAQWFTNPAYTLAQWLKVTQPGGLLLASFPGSESFPEWKKHTQTLGIPFTGNSLPDTEEMVIKLSSDQTQVDYYEDTVAQTFNSAAGFFRHLKKIGAGKQLEGRPLTPQEMKLLINHWDEQEQGDITISWHVVFLAVKKNFS